MARTIADVVGLRLTYYWCEMYNGAIFEVRSFSRLTKSEARNELMAVANADGLIDAYGTEDIRRQGSRSTPKPTEE